MEIHVWAYHDADQQRIIIMTWLFMGSHMHALPVEQGRFSRPQVPRNLRRCSLCSTRSVGDERHYLFDCPKFDEIRAQFAQLYESSAGAMRSFVWHKDQQAVCDCMTAVIRLAET